MESSGRRERNRRGKERDGGTEERRDGRRVKEGGRGTDGVGRMDGEVGRKPWLGFLEWAREGRGFERMWSDLKSERERT